MDENFSKRLKEAMELRNLTQAQLMKKIDDKFQDDAFNRSLLSLYLSGKRRPNTTSLKMLAEILQVSPLWLMGITYDESDLPEDEHPAFVTNANAKPDEYTQELPFDINNSSSKIMNKNNNWEDKYFALCEAVKYAEKISNLSPDQRQIVYNMIDTLLKSNK